MVNNQGRAQRFYQVFVPEGGVQVSWRWLHDLMAASGRGGWQTIDEIAKALAEMLPVFRPLPEVAPPADFRIVGQKIPRQPERYSGRTSIHADVNVSEPAPPDDPQTPLAFSMEGYEGQPPAALISRFWAPGWNSVQALNKFQQEIAGPLRGGDPGRRLFDRPDNASVAYFDTVPAAFRPRDGEWFAVPLHHIFGSEPLSVMSPGVAERSPCPPGAGFHRHHHTR